MRKELERDGQAPHSAILGCADSRCPLETIFDTLPGDIFVLRNAGNTCTHAEGSMVGSLEFCTGKLGARLILVLGHTKPGISHILYKLFLICFCLALGTYCATYNVGCWRSATPRKCGAVYGATQAYVEGQRAKNGIESALEGLLEDMSPVATSALKEHMEVGEHEDKVSLPTPPNRQHPASHHCSIRCLGLIVHVQWSSSMNGRWENPTILTGSCWVSVS